MARSSSNDPVEKFRFQISILDSSLLDTLLSTPFSSAVDVGVGLLAPSGFKSFTRAGFSEVSSPKLTVNSISYRENIDNQRFTKIPGLVKYEPLTLKRGVTTNVDLFNWYTLVNNDMGLLASAQVLQSSAKSPPVQNLSFRRDVTISVFDITGSVVKSWVLFNTWPSSFRSGNDMSADSEEKLIEEMELTYEFFIELPAGETLESLKAKDAISGVITTVLSQFSTVAGSSGTTAGAFF